MSDRDLMGLYALYNSRYFDSILPPCKVMWSRQLTRTAGNIDVFRRVIKLSVPLLVDAFRQDKLFPPEFEVCGVPCRSSEAALREILKHEMIHLWLHAQGLPSGHGPEFKAKATELGQPKIRHDIDVPLPTSGWVYACVYCGHEFPRRRRYSRPVACARCCASYTKGQYDERYRLKGKRIK